MSKKYWINYWNNQTHGQHRSQNEEFLKSESDEKLFHLKKGGKLLDFGCGSADLLSYYSRYYEFCVGADSSKMMLEKACERLKSFNNQDNVELINCDNLQIWNEIKNKFGENFKFNCITTGQVVQYLDKKQVEDFILNAALYLTKNGKICMFDIVDARKYKLWEAGLFERNSFDFYVVIKLVYCKLRSIVNKLKGKPLHPLGFGYPPSFFMNLAEKYKLKVSYVNSMFYEYRYHIIFCKNL